MQRSDSTPREELEAIIGRYGHEIDEPEALPFLAKIRQERIISDREWADVLRWVDEAMIFLEKDSFQDRSGAIMLDANPRNADWICIVRAQRLSGYRMPNWASLWLWWIGHGREGGPFWPQIGRIARSMNFPRFSEGRRQKRA